jgi:uncharacterized protein YjbJ (UPF0337 family)
MRRGRIDSATHFRAAGPVHQPAEAVPTRRLWLDSSVFRPRPHRPNRAIWVVPESDGGVGMLVRSLSGTKSVSLWQECITMNKDRVAGAAKEIKGSAKETVGKAIGDAKLQSDGKADKVEGKIQNAIGGVKDALKR